MIQIRATILTLGLLLLASPAPIAAQATPDIDFGIAAGVETLPAALRTPDKDPTASALGAGADIRLTVGRLGPFSLEGRASLHSGARRGLTIYNLTQPTGPQVGVLLNESSTATPGPQAAWDARLRVDLGPGEPGSSAFTVGGGLMTEGIPYAAGSIGHLWRDGRLGLELDVAAYRVGWVRRELALHQPDPYVSNTLIPGDLTTSYFERWHLGFGVRAVYTFDVWN